MSNFPANVRGVVFDIDGVLVDSEAGYDHATCAALTAIGFRPNSRIRMSLVGLALTACEGPLIAEYGPSFPWRDFVLSYKSYAQSLPEVAALKEGVSDAIRRLRSAGRMIAFATNATDSSANTVLRAHALLDVTDVLVTQNDVRHPKPDPDIYLIAAAKLDLPPASLVAVEDSLVGITAAKRSGMFAALVPDLVPLPSAWRDQADGIFESVTEIVDQLLAYSS